MNSEKSQMSLWNMIAIQNAIKNEGIFITPVAVMCIFEVLEKEIFEQ